MDSKVEGTVLPDAAPAQVVVSVPTAAFEDTLAKYWDEVKDRLHPELVKKATKGGFREIDRKRVVKAAGGESEFFRTPLLTLVAEYLAGQECQALAYTDVAVIEHGVDITLIQASVYLEPLVTWSKVPGTQDVPLKIRVPKVDASLLDQVIDAEVNRIQDESAVLVPSMLSVSEDLVVVLDGQTVIDGKVWEPGTFKSNKWLIRDDMFKIPGLKSNIMGLNVGDSKTFDVTFTEAFGPDLAGKTGTMTVRVNQIYRRDKPAIDDDLAITAGFKSLLDWRGKLRTEYERILAQEKEKLFTSSLNALLLNPEYVDMENIPNVWLANKARAIYAEQRGYVRTEEDLLARYAGAMTLSGEPIKTKDDLLAFFASRAAQMLAEDLVYRSWGKLNGVAGNTKLGNLEEYAAAVRRELLSKVEIEEVDPNGAV
jgi:hypothetical protein